MAVVTIDKLRKRYDGAAEDSVKDMTLTVADGEFMVLLGPSGCGKSSALRMIAGLESITSGTVAIDGRPINHVPAKDRDIAMVFQSYALYPHMTVADNLAFGLRRRRVPAPEIDRRVKDVAVRLGLSPYLARKPHALSGGQRQRVALGRAIVRDPKVFLFDEPLSNLDAALRVTTRNELVKQQHELGTTTIYVTHDQVEAMTMGDRICIMDGGAVVQIGRPLDVYRNPADTFVARFLGNPPMNLLPATLEREGSGYLVRVAGGRYPVEGYAPESLARFVNGPVTLGVRPEDLYESGSGGPHLAPIRARVVTVELLGAETLLILTAETGEEIVARIGRDSASHPGDTADLFLDTTKIHLFDPTTTKVIPRSR
jgi:multiple sugar transport system ATP-binding protein